MSSIISIVCSFDNTGDFLMAGLAFDWLLCCWFAMKLLTTAGSKLSMAGLLGFTKMSDTQVIDVCFDDM